ncbi:MAG: hypothetical protein HKN92_07655 [Chitinophagales bacterium]|nr:hypothetical protein [Chitinophagales bacterium]
MKITLGTFFLLSALFLSSCSNAQNTITHEDLNIVIGEWSGTLTYVDYRSNKPFTMPSDLIVENGGKKNQLFLFISYPNEPKANSREKIKINKSGSQLNKKDVTSKQIMSNGNVHITIEYSGKDNGENATIRSVYIMGNNQFIIRKEVKFENSEEWLVRNEYKYSRKS